MIVTEREIEIPWCLSRIEGSVIDIGSSENAYSHLLPEGSFLLDQRPLVQQQPMNTIFVLADIRDIPLDLEFDTVICLSTYEHFGMAHSPYNTIAEEGVAQDGLAEMWRLVTPGGKLIMTIPFGKLGHYGWVRQWDYPAMMEEFASIWDCLEEEEYFQYDAASDSYLPIESEQCVWDYNFHLCRATAIACLVFRKNT